MDAIPRGHVHNSRVCVHNSRGRVHSPRGAYITREGVSIPREGASIPREGASIHREGVYITRRGASIRRGGRDAIPEGGSSLRGGRPAPARAVRDSARARRKSFGAPSGAAAQIGDVYYGLKAQAPSAQPNGLGQMSPSPFMSPNGARQAGRLAHPHRPHSAALQASSKQSRISQPRTLPWAEEGRPFGASRAAIHHL
jgi:hypothetical protein